MVTANEKLAQSLEALKELEIPRKLTHLFRAKLTH